MDSLSLVAMRESPSWGEPDKKRECPPRCSSGRWAQDAAVIHSQRLRRCLWKAVVLLEDGLALFERRAAGGTDALIFQQGFSCGVS